MSRHLITMAFPLFALVAFGQGQQRQEIRDPSYHMTGTIATRRDGVKEARDRNYRLVGKGDLLSALVWKPRPAK